MWMNCLMVDLFKITLLPNQTIDYWWSGGAQNKVFCCLLALDTSSTTRQFQMSTPSLSGLSLSLKSLDLSQANIHNCLTCATLLCKGKEQYLLTFQVSSYCSLLLHGSTEGGSVFRLCISRIRLVCILPFLENCIIRTFDLWNHVRTRILVQVMIYRRFHIGRDGHLDQS